MHEGEAGPQVVPLPKCGEEAGRTVPGDGGSPAPTPIEAMMLALVGAHALRVFAAE